MADLPLPQLNHRTPLAAAKTPNLDALARQGEVGLVRTTPPGCPPTSEVTNLAIFGYDPRKYPQLGRSPLEAASLGVQVWKDDVVFRCNLVTLKDDQHGYDIDRLGPHVVLEDPSAGHIGSDDSRDLIQELNNQLATEFLQFYAGVGYRHLMVWIGGKSRVACTPPFDLAGKPVVGGLPTGDGADMLRKVMESAAVVLSPHPINEDRIEQGLKPANGIWIWGQGEGGAPGGAAEARPLGGRPRGGPGGGEPQRRPGGEDPRDRGLRRAGGGADRRGDRVRARVSPAGLVRSSRAGVDAGPRAGPRPLSPAPARRRGAADGRIGDRLRRDGGQGRGEDDRRGAPADGVFPECLKVTTSR